MTKSCPRTPPRVQIAEVEARIRKALAALADEPDLTVVAAADQFHVPVRRLRARHQGRKARSQREGSG